MTGRQEVCPQYKRSYCNGALDHLKRMYGETIPAGNLHFIMGTMAAHLHHHWPPALDPRPGRTRSAEHPKVLAASSRFVFEIGLTRSPEKIVLVAQPLYDGLNV